MAATSESRARGSSASRPATRLPKPPNFGSSWIGSPASGVTTSEVPEASSPSSIRTPPRTGEAHSHAQRAAERELERVIHASLEGEVDDATYRCIRGERHAHAGSVRDAEPERAGERDACARRLTEQRRDRVHEAAHAGCVQAARRAAERAGAGQRLRWRLEQAMDWPEGDAGAGHRLDEGRGGGRK